MTSHDSAALKVDTALMAQWQATIAQTKLPPPPPSRRPQPVGVLYGGAHRFSAETPTKLGRLALAAFHQWTPDPRSLALATGIDVDGVLLTDIWTRLEAKLSGAPIEDLRVDFEDGLGPIGGDDEIALALRVGDEAARCVANGTAPPLFGIRPKAMTAGDDAPARTIATLDAFFRAYRRGLDDREASPHPNFVVTLPKVEHPDAVEIAAAALTHFERAYGLPPASLEVMVESLGGLWSEETGALRVPALIAAGGARVIGVHFGTYDYSASVGIAAPDQHADHASCALARQLLLAACRPLGVIVSDGATHEMPIGPHRAGDDPLTSAEVEENRTAVYAGLRRHSENVTRAFTNGIGLGWDLHPTQLIARYAAAFAFFRRPLADMTRRMKQYQDRASAAALSGAMFDDAASAAGVHVFFDRGYSCGALSVADLAAAGLSPPIAQNE